ncbi:MAG: carboxypeptidase-like regulatory domain-containing protein [Arachidicoccus sp.]|nr:carboxypeptidase-like regulatory domain-containing protein [Arachidicoccus sp.]
MKQPLFIIIFLISTVKTFSQKVGGYVFNKNGEALVAATVRNLTTDKATITNGKGYFELNINSLDDKLSVEYIGYDIKQTAASSLSQNDTIFIVQSSIDLQDVVISVKDNYELVRRIIVNTKQALPQYCSYNYYFKDFIKIGGKIKYYSDALVQTDLNTDKSVSYLLASRALKKIDSTDEKVIGKIRVSENINNNFLRRAMFKNIIFEENEKGNLKKDFRISVNHNSDSMIIIVFQPIGKMEKQADSTIWFVNKNDSIIREIHEKLPSAQKGKLRTSSLVAKQFETNKEEILHYEKIGGFLFLKSNYSTKNATIQGRMLLKFNAFDYQADAAFIVINSKTDNQEIPKLKDKKELHWYDTLQSFGNNYTTLFWENINGIQQTQDEKNFFK